MTTSRQPALLGIDVGTSSVKLLLYFLGETVPDAGRMRTVRVPVRVSHPRAGWSEADPLVWWRAIRLAVRQLDPSDAHILGIGLSTLFPSLVITNHRGRSLRPAILYDDRRSTAEVEEFAHSPFAHPALQHLLTGNLVRPGTISLSSLLWVKRHEPKVLDDMYLLGDAGMYLRLRLTGRYVMDATCASLSGLYATASGEAWLRGVCRARGVPIEKVSKRLADLTYADYLDLLTAGRPDLREQILADMPPGMDRDALGRERITLPEPGWVDVLVDAVGLETEWLPQVLWPGDCLARLMDTEAKAVGLERGTPVAVGAGDTACAALGLGLATEEEVAASCGSTDCLMSLQRTAVFSTRTMNVAYMDADTWLAIAPMSATGAAVDWFVRTFLGRGPRGHDRFFRLAAKAPAGSRGLVFLPYLAGERSPVFDPSARGMFFGLTHETGLAEMARAVIEGVAFGHRQILRMADVRLGRQVERVIAAGGGTANPLWRQIRADAADRPYLYADCPEVSALGAALLGGVAAGVFNTWQDAAAEARRRVRFTEVRPDPGAWHRLQRNFEVYSSLYDAVKHCF